MRSSPGALASVAAAALALLAACAHVVTPRAGEPVTLQPGHALVYGRLRMVDAADEHVDYKPFSFEPCHEPFCGPSPHMTLELRQRMPPGGALVYKSHPAMPIDEDGAFAWILEAGDYQLLGNPRVLGSERFTPDESETLATFAVPASGGTVYLGTLTVVVVYDLERVVRAYPSGEPEYVITAHRVADEREAELARLRTRFPALPEPLATALMR